MTTRENRNLPLGMINYDNELKAADQKFSHVRDEFSYVEPSLSLTSDNARSGIVEKFLRHRNSSRKFTFIFCCDDHVRSFFAQFFGIIRELKGRAWYSYLKNHILDIFLYLRYIEKKKQKRLKRELMLSN